MFRYQITEVKYIALLEAQDGKCAICESSTSRNPRSPNGHWQVDHNHQTGEVRGLLCLRCNSALGWFEDNQEAVLAYLS